LPCGFFFFFFNSREEFLVTSSVLLLSVARTTHFRAIAIEETFSVVMTRQQQQRDEGDANIALIQVPIGDSGEHVSIDPRNLSRTNVEDILGVLQSELAPLRVWLECAKAYLAEDNEAAFLEIVGSGCSPGEQRAFLVSLSSTRRRRSLSSSSSSSIFDEWRSDVDDRVSPTFADTFVLSFSLSLFERRQRQHYNNRNRTVLPERRVRSRETFVLLGRAPGKRCRQITIRRKRKRRASEYYERAKTTRTFNASG
jgi:hypothetical protein